VKWTSVSPCRGDMFGDNTASNADADAGSAAFDAAVEARIAAAEAAAEAAVNATDDELAAVAAGMVERTRCTDAAQFQQRFPEVPLAGMFSTAGRYLLSNNTCDESAWIQRLKLSYAELLPNFADNYSLRRYTLGEILDHALVIEGGGGGGDDGSGGGAGGGGEGGSGGGGGGGWGSAWSPCPEPRVPFGGSGKA